MGRRVGFCAVIFVVFGLFRGGSSGVLYCNEGGGIFSVWKEIVCLEVGWAAEDIVMWGVQCDFGDFRYDRFWSRVWGCVSWAWIIELCISDDIATDTGYFQADFCLV